MRISIDNQAPVIERDVLLVLQRVLHRKWLSSARVSVRVGDTFGCGGGLVWPDDLQIRSWMTPSQKEGVLRSRWCREPGFAASIYLPLPTMLETLALHNHLSCTELLIRTLCEYVGIKPTAKMLATRLRWDLPKLAALR